MPNRYFQANGSMIGYSPYAIKIKAKPEPPMQSFFLIHKTRGKVGEFPITFDARVK